MQIIIRIFGAGLPVFDFAAGEIIEGQFKSFQELPSVIEERFPALAGLVAFDGLLGTQAYLKSHSLGAAVALITAHPKFAGMQFYPNFLVFNIEDYVETEKENS